MPLDENRTLELTDLMNKIGYHFDRIELLDEALTHCSLRNERPDKASNERLEFFGDAVLGFIVTKQLLKLNKVSAEGDLTDRRKELVNNSYLEVVADKLLLKSFMNVGRSIPSNAQEPKWMASAALEALVAAIFIDGGECEATSFIRKFVIC
ncbi:MAG: ribonuclease III domain-containing protein [Methanomassiliicoccales archaeon]